MKYPNTVHHIPAYELKLIFDWADYAKTSDEFWARVMLASAAYGPRVQVKMARLVDICMAELPPLNLTPTAHSTTEPE